MENDSIRVRISAADKATGEAILGELGLSTSQALRLFWQQLILQRGLPFAVRIPTNEKTDA